MTRLAAAILWASILVGLASCGSQVQVPDAMKPVLARWSDAGIHCHDPVVGQPENLPQWSCAGSLDKVDMQISVTGDSAGVADLLVQVPAATNRGAAEAALADFVAISPSLGATKSAVATWLHGWEGADLMQPFGGRTFRVQADQTWISLGVTRATP